MEYGNFFTTYHMTEPPPRKTKASILEDKSEVKPELNIPNYPMVVTVDSPYMTPEQITSNTENPFIFQTDQPYFVNDDNEPSVTQNDSSSIIQNIVSLARSFVGKPYVSGGTSPSRGFDCSGLLSYTFKQNGIDLPRSTYEIFKYGREVQLSDIQAGDIICTPGSGRSGRHVKMVSQVDEDGIHVIEAKGKRWGVVEGLLQNTSNIITIRRPDYSSILLRNDQEYQPSNISISGKFSNRNDFIRTLDQSYRKALADNGMDPEWATLLTASASIESAWGKSPSGSFNYGGVKVTDSLIRAGVLYTNRMTVDYVPGRGNIKHSQPFRNFSSVQDYCNYMVKWLRSSSRYGKMFTKYTPNQPQQAWEYVLRAGYGGGSESNIRTYIGWIGNRYNTIKNLS